MDSKIIKLKGNENYFNAEIKKYNEMKEKKQTEKNDNHEEENEDDNDEDENDNDDDNDKEEKKTEENGNDEEENDDDNEDENEKDYELNYKPKDDDDQTTFLKLQLQWSGYSCFIAFDRIQITFIPKGEEIFITEYDGAETIHFKSKIKWVSA